jgi:hypothetical protein
MLAAALIGLGLLILFLNVGEAATLVRSLRIVGHEADSLGILTATAMAVRRTLQAYLFNHTEFLRALYEVLLSFSGMLLIVTGTVFSAVIFAAGGESQKKEEGMSISLPLIRRIDGSKTQPRTSNKKYCC